MESPHFVVVVCPAQVIRGSVRQVGTAGEFGGELARFLFIEDSDPRISLDEISRITAMIARADASPVSPKCSSS